MFLGRQLAQRTTHTYRNGKIVESVTVSDPVWTDEDRAWALALLAEERDRCSGCGQPLAECMDPRTARTWSAEAQWCQGCIVIEAAQDNDAERERQTGHRERGKKYAVRRTG